jgi:hypothetical protein
MAMAEVISKGAAPRLDPRAAEAAIPRDYNFASDVLA